MIVDRHKQSTALANCHRRIGHRQLQRSGVVQHAPGIDQVELAQRRHVSSIEDRALLDRPQRIVRKKSLASNASRAGDRRRVVVEGVHPRAQPPRNETGQSAARADVEKRGTCKLRDPQHLDHRSLRRRRCCRSSSVVKNRRQFSPNSNRSPWAISCACWSVTEGTCERERVNGGPIRDGRGRFVLSVRYRAGTIGHRLLGHATRLARSRHTRPSHADGCGEFDVDSASDHRRLRCCCETNLRFLSTPLATRGRSYPQTALRRLDFAREGDVVYRRSSQSTCILPTFPSRPPTGSCIATFGVAARARFC